MQSRTVAWFFVAVGLPLACTSSDSSSGPTTNPSSSNPSETPSLDASSLPVASGRWFGSITFEVDYKTLPPQPTPGISMTKTHSDRWRHTITITEDGTRTTASRWSFYDYQRSVMATTCYEQIGTNLTSEEGATSKTEAGKYLSLAADGDDAYRAIELPVTVMDTVPMTTHNHVRTTTCDGGLVQTSDNTVPTPRYAALTFEQLKGSFGADKRTARGSKTYEDLSAHIKLRWSLKRDKEVVAKVGGPYRVERGERVRLDASQSRGDIDEYKWTVTPGDACKKMGAPMLATQPSIGKEVTKAEKVFELTALCPLEIALQVRGKAGEDEDDGDVTVTARKWETEWVAPKVESWATLDQDQAGTNRCALEPNIAEALSHYIHHESTTKWRDSAYTIGGPVSDPGGPFDGAYWVESHKVKVHRVEASNPMYDPGGSVYQHNAVTKNNKPIADLLGPQIRAHEAAHSALMKEWLDFVRGTSLDAARSIEGIAAMTDGDVELHSDALLREGDDGFCRSTVHPLVWEKLKAQYGIEGKVYLPAEPIEPPMMPLYKLGQEKLPCE